MVFGYYIEVSNVHKDKVPEDYIRKQTLTNGERYITEELKEVEKLIDGNGRALLRQSGTEPVVRVMVESEENCEQYVDRIVDVIISRGHKAE